MPCTALNVSRRKTQYVLRYLKQKPSRLSYNPFQYIVVAEATLENITHAVVPGSFMVDVIPYRVCLCSLFHKGAPLNELI